MKISHQCFQSQHQELLNSLIPSGSKFMKLSNLVLMKFLVFLFSRLCDITLSQLICQFIQSTQRRRSWGGGGGAGPPPQLELQGNNVVDKNKGKIIFLTNVNHYFSEISSQEKQKVHKINSIGLKLPGT